jgi:hypothetical protein
MNHQRIIKYQYLQIEFLKQSEIRGRGHAKFEGWYKERQKALSSLGH